MDKSDFELAVLEDFRKLKYYCKDWQLANADLIGVEFRDFEVKFFDHTYPEKYFFEIKNPRLDQRPPKTFVTVYYKPRNRINKEHYSAGFEAAKVYEIFQIWVELVRSYSTISLDVDDQFLKQYENEYFTEFKILDEDADRAPFSDAQQKLLYYTLESIEEAIVELNDSTVNTDEIVKETRNLRERISTLTKNQNMGWYSRIFARIKLKGPGYALKLGKKVGEILMTKGVEMGIDYLKTEAPKWIAVYLALKG
jgi:hypothetical protein